MIIKRILNAAAVMLCAGLLAVSAAATDIILEYTTRTDIQAAIQKINMNRSLNPEAEKMQCYHSDYAYQCLGQSENGEKKQLLYKMLDDAAIQLHYDYTLDVPEDEEDEGKYVVVELNYEEVGLTFNDAVNVWDTYKHDHPLYYWISNTIWYNVNSIYVVTDPLYNEGEERKQWNSLIEEKAAEYLAMVEGETSAYRIALAYHDALIETIDYTYKSDGRTPEDALWAHSILGILGELGGVCESYARTFEFLLNAAGVENILVTGVSGDEGHAWNLVRLDDGGWYWCDLTWDDDPEWMWGTNYNYFCVNDTQNVLWTDGENSSDYSGYFLDSHTAGTPDGYLLDYLYPLPERASEPYRGIGEELILRDCFTAGEFTCSVAGYNEVQVTGINAADAELIIPDTIEYEGILYDVISIGCTTEEGRYIPGPIPSLGVSPEIIRIGKNLRFIWNTVLPISTIRAFEVDAENPMFCSENGVLFTKNKFMLIEYPDAAEMREYTVPQETLRIAYRAFENCANLEKLTIEKRVNRVGFINNGYIENSAASSENQRYITGEWYRIYTALAGEKIIEISPYNSRFTILDGWIYQKNSDGTLKLLLAARNLEAAVVPETVSAIETLAFANMENLCCVVIPAGVSEIEALAFEGCRNFAHVYFLGNPPAKWISAAFADVSSELVLYYDFSASGWTMITWTAPDGGIFKTKLISWETNPETGEKIPHVHRSSEWSTDEEKHWKNCSCGESIMSAVHADKDSDGICDLCGYTMQDEPVLLTLRGKIISDFRTDYEILIELIPVDGTEAAASTTIPGDATEYVLENIKPGSYVLRVQKKNHVAREYELNLK